VNDDELQTVFTTTHPATAEMVRIALENQRIAAFVDGSQQAGFIGALDVHVSVRQKDAARAEAFLQKLEHGNAPEEVGEEVLDDQELDEGEG
jgi:hypothetical protein